MLLAGSLNEQLADNPNLDEDYVAVLQQTCVSCHVFWKNNHKKNLNYITMLQLKNNQSNLQ